MPVLVGGLRNTATWVLEAEGFPCDSVGWGRGDLDIKRAAEVAEGGGRWSVGWNREQEGRRWVDSLRNWQ